MPTMVFARLCFAAALVAAQLACALQRPAPGHQPRIIADPRAQTAQTAVKYDQYSLSVQNQRVIWYAGECLWRDILEKIRAMGYNGVTIYIDWALLEGKQGNLITPTILDLQPFFDVAKATGMWINARPGPYINAEVSGGGFPGWLSRSPATLRSHDPRYLNATDLYMSKIGALIARNQITNGGPVILVQPENEYTYADGGLQGDYMEYVQQQLRNAGVTVPLMSNDLSPDGNFAPGTGQGAVDIYGYDGYPLGFNCGDPTNWGTSSLPTDYGRKHASQSPSTPHSIVEFQGGSFDPWGGFGLAKCAQLLDWQFENVFYKNDFSMGVKMLSLYMTYGGTNWGNIGHDGGYTSYDYGAAITEERTLNRQKYAEAKLIANGMRSSPAFLTSVAQDDSRGSGAYTGNTDVFVSGVFDSQSSSKFFFQRQNQYYSTGRPTYKLTLPTSQGNLTIPQLTGQLSLNGRESKMAVTDFNLGGITLLYSSAEVFTWQKRATQTTLVLYGDIDQTHEFAIKGAKSANQIQGSGAQSKAQNGGMVVNTKIQSQRQIVKFDNGLVVHILDRYSAYDYWVIYPDGFANSGLPIVNMPAGYLVRNVQVVGKTANITADLNETSLVEVIGAPDLQTIVVNSKTLSSSVNSTTGILSGTATYTKPSFNVPSLSSMSWQSIDGLPEIQNGYRDDKWPKGNLAATNNTNRFPLDTPTSLYAGDYGFYTGSLVYRGRFVANGDESQLQLSPQGGYGFGYTLWINNTYVGNWLGNGNEYYYYGYFALPQLTAGATYVFTVVVDHMGLQEDPTGGSSNMKQPRGIMQYTLNTKDGGSRPNDVITWKLTGNLGGEDYIQKDLGPLNEGGSFAERQGYHLPGAPTSGAGWSTGNNPQTGIKAAGVRFYTTTFNLDFPTGYDISLSIDAGAGSISNTCPVRAVFYVNGYQFGKYVSNIGPQTSFPVPEGIWNYKGSNKLAVLLWALTPCGGSIGRLALSAGTPVQSGYGPISGAPKPSWQQRPGAY